MPWTSSLIVDMEELWIWTCRTWMSCFIKGPGEEGDLGFIWFKLFFANIRVQPEFNLGSNFCKSSSCSRQ